MKNAQLLVKSTCQLGESILWDKRNASIYWVDILGKQIYKHKFGGEQTSIWNLDDYVSKIVLNDRHGFILGMQGMLASWEEATNIVKPIIDIPHENGQIRTNDGGLDPDGNFWIGTMHMDAISGRGKLYCYKDQKLHVMLDAVSIPNGIVWSGKLPYTYFIDTFTNEIRRYDFTKDTNETAHYDVLVKIPSEYGSPDGMCIGPDGNLWVAHWGGYGVYCWDINTGKLLDRIYVDAPHVTSCVFGGPNNQDLFISTAKVGLDEQQLLKYPNSGSVFHYKIS
ncbi:MULTISPECIES: SMP-30/gluconolactonase/LRE family protein [unclassified Sphingobacterium]|uniref:SMP-30/gluconolactonase/LRE family protein n=1 Tax=unclassified Sphingobacterium TaxID=2609468 RepID=UPI00104CC7A6|nr:MULTISPECIES: SMP-30/gluconolactonase/LRE family protein [unclassified Sphingobacterium]MCS3554267.1 sugar lactone lactonase YvrE [Sphingobacterium sp. JUb21]TCR08100.1 sugar lactone lactonase YvrE [Sphingobacterium sp. JUb20]